MRSRCTGVFGTINYGVRPLGATLGGLAAGLVGIGPVIIGSALGGTLAALWLVGSPRACQDFCVRRRWVVSPGLS